MLKFEKYQGAGNDFVIVSEKELIEKGLITRICKELKQVYRKNIS